MKRITRRFFAICLLLFLSSACTRGPDDSSNRSQKAGRHWDTNFWVAAAAGLNMRAKPDQAAAIITTIPFGSEVVPIDSHGQSLTIDGRTGDWLLVRFNGKEGWLFSGYLIPLDPATVRPLIDRLTELTGVEFPKTFVPARSYKNLNLSALFVERNYDLYAYHVDCIAIAKNDCNGHWGIKVVSDKHKKLLFSDIEAPEEMLGQIRYVSPNVVVSVAESGENGWNNAQYTAFVLRTRKVIHATCGGGRGEIPKFPLGFLMGHIPADEFQRLMPASGSDFDHFCSLH